MGAAPFLEQLGRSVRERRTELGLTRRALAERSGLSERFLAQLELGSGNISIVRLLAVAAALGRRPSELLEAAEARVGAARTLVALLGLRGAGKSTVGALLAERLAVPFVELDELVEERAGLGRGEIFELHGEPYYREIERDALRAWLGSGRGGVLAAGGGLVTDAESYRLLRSSAVTVWLRTTPEEHLGRVMAQGDHRPMAASASALDDIRRILRGREPLYAQAELAVDTSARPPIGVVEAVLAHLERTRRGQ